MLVRESLPRTTQTTATVTCPAANPIVVSGGYSGVTGANPQFTIDNYPSSAGAWTVTMNDTDANNSWTAYAICSK